jgi:exosome complex exonuclease DIS3/RRP44
VVADARVTRVKDNGLIVFVPKYGIEGPVYLTPPAAGKRSQGKGGKGNNAASEQQPSGEEPAYVLDEETQTVTSL